MAIERQPQLTRNEQPERDPVLQALLTAPIDDEPLTPEDEDALAEAYDELRRGEGVPEAEVRRRLGLP